MTDKPTPPSDDDQHVPAEHLAAAMTPARLRRPEPVSAEALAAFLAQPEPGTTVH